MFQLKIKAYNPQTNSITFVQSLNTSIMPKGIVLFPFIGLCDKNKEELYAGYIVRAADEDNDKYVIAYNKRVARFQLYLYAEYPACLDSPGINFQYKGPYAAENLLIVGNIYEK